MLILVVKLLLFLFGMLLLGEEASTVLSVTSFLAALLLTSLNQYFGSRRFTCASSLGWFFISLFSPVFCPFLPLFCFDLSMQAQYRFSALILLPLIKNFTRLEISEVLFLILLILLALCMRYGLERIRCLSEESKHIRDNSTELTRMLTQKNKHLIEKQDYEIHLATLRERNRIAREIHDNVGHILSRSILQVGALQALNKEDSLSEKLTGLKDTLSGAMNSIRGSVHNLRDDAVDLYASFERMLDGETYEITFDYDVSDQIPVEVKYCLLTVLKEAMTNIAKHSDATCIHIAMQEHPAMYQLMIRDNGTQKPSLLPRDNGMGISNMQERAEALGGRFSVSWQDGFRIFITIPKQEELSDYEHNTR